MLLHKIVLLEYIFPQIPRIIIAICFLVLTTSCNSVETRYGFATRDDTVKAYDNFLKKFPESKFSEDAKVRRDKLIAERKERVERYKKKHEDRRRKKAEKRRIFLSRQNEAQSNSAGIKPTAESIDRANKLLVKLNAAAGKSLQTDSRPLYKTSEIKKNTPPLFLLDSVTGRFILRLTPTETRTLMLRHVQEVRTNVNKTSIKILDIPEITSTSYEVVVDMGEKEDKVILVNSSGNNSWKHFIRVLTTGEANARKIEASLKELVSIYRE